MVWMLSTLGFVSVSCARKKGGRDAALDPDLLMVRARLRSHLEALQVRFPVELGSLTIVDTIHNDYPHRLLAPKQVWAAVVAKMVMDTDYGNFKSAVAQVQGVAGGDYQDALHRIWSVLRAIEKPRRGTLPGDRSWWDRPEPPTGDL